MKLKRITACIMAAFMIMTSLPADKVMAYTGDIDDSLVFYDGSEDILSDAPGDDISGPVTDAPSIESAVLDMGGDESVDDISARGSKRSPGVSQRAVSTICSCPRTRSIRRPFRSRRSSSSPNAP